MIRPPYHELLFLHKHKSPGTSKVGSTDSPDLGDAVLDQGRSAIDGSKEQIQAAVDAYKYDKYARKDLVLKPAQPWDGHVRWPDLGKFKGWTVVPTHITSGLMEGEQEYNGR